MRCSVSISTTESAYGTGVSETFRLYVVDENKLPAPMPGASDDEKYSRLVKAVVEQGGLWGEVRLGVRLFAQVLELIDHEIGATGFLPVLAFNNSPHDILGADSSCPAFGYFNPEQIRDLQSCLKAIPTELMEAAGRNISGSVETVFWTLRAAVDEAARRRYALAVIHGTPRQAT